MEEMTEEELKKVCKELGLKMEEELGDMSDFSEVEIAFLYFKLGYEFAMKRKLIHKSKRLDSRFYQWQTNHIT